MYAIVSYNTLTKGDIMPVRTCEGCGADVDTLDCDGYCIDCSAVPYGRCRACGYIEWLYFSGRCEDCGDTADDERTIPYRSHIRKPFLGVWARDWEHSEYPELPFLGIELEVECPDFTPDESYALAERVERLHENIVVSSDESLDNGFEVKFGPAVLHYHVDIWPKICEILCEGGAESWHYGTTGLHVHINRPAVLYPDILRRFSYTMPHALARHIYGRSPGQYCRTSEWGTHCAFVNDNAGLSACRTLEFRGGKGTLKFQRILAIAELVLATTAYVNSSIRPYETTTLSWYEWTEYVRAFTTRWPHLVEYIRSFESRHTALCCENFWGIAGTPLLPAFCDTYETASARAVIVGPENI